MFVFNILNIILHLVLQVSGQQDTDDCNCGVRREDDSPFTVRISGPGAEEASVNEFPWAALLDIRKNGRRNVMRCGGTLINDKFVLTAAHCVPKSTGMDVDVILGEHNRRTKLESDELRLSAVPPFIVHDQYEENKRHVIYDFTLLRLSERVNFNLYPHIRPICLPDSSFKDNQGDVVTVIGWGNTEVDLVTSGNLIEGFDRTPSNTLQKIDIRLYRQKKCEDIFRPHGIEIRDINMCAASKLGDACGGDSGGGLVKKSRRGRFYEIVGVVSYGVGCRSTFKGENLPGVYARVSSAVGWIKSRTSSGRSCRRPTATEIPVHVQPTSTSTEKTAAQFSSGWGEWTSFSECSKTPSTCGIGKKSRDRFCKGSSCGRSQQTQERICNARRC